MVTMHSRSALRFLVAIPVILVALTGCSAAGSSGGPDAGTASAGPSAAPEPTALDCAAVAKSFTDQSKTQGAAFSYVAVDPMRIIGIQGLPANVLDTGCFVSADQKAAHVLIPASDSTVYDALATILEAAGYVRNDSQNVDPKTEHSFYSSDKSVPTNEYEVDAIDHLTKDRLARESLPSNLFSANLEPMLYVVAGIH